MTGSRHACATLLLVVAGTAAASGVSAQGRSWTPQVTFAAGLNRGVSYHAPIAPTGRKWSQSAAIAVGPRLGQHFLVPRLTVSYHSALAEVSDITIGRLELDGIASLSRSDLVVPFIGGGVAGHTGRFDRCQARDPVASQPCSGSRSGFGWQATAGVLFPADDGPSAAFNISYIVNRKAFDALVLTLSLTS